MDFAKAIKQVIQIYKLDRNTISEVASSKESTKIALIFVVVTGLLTGMGSGLFGIIVAPIMHVIGLAFFVTGYHFLARLLGGKGELIQLLRVTGYTYAAIWVSVIPIIGPIISLLLMVWGIVVGVVVLKTIYKLSTIRAVIIELIPTIGIGIFILGIITWQLGLI